MCSCAPLHVLNVVMRTATCVKCGHAHHYMCEMWSQHEACIPTVVMCTNCALNVGVARTVYMHYIFFFCDFPAKNTVCTPYIYGSGQPELNVT